MRSDRSFSDALRRLLVVIGCVVLATAQPMSAFGESAAPGVQSPDTVIYPNGAGEKTATTGPRSDSGFGGQAYLVVAVLLAAAGGWILWKRKSGITGIGGASRKLQIEESRSLGNRQHLVVTSYEGKRYLLGVTTERIELLTQLSDVKHDGEEPRS